MAYSTSHILRHYDSTLHVIFTSSEIDGVDITLYTKSPSNITKAPEIDISIFSCIPTIPPT